MICPSEADPVSRLVPELPLPPYAYVPGCSPHPVSDPKGHSFGMPPQRPKPPDAERWVACQPYLYGLDLFNHGYYWEAHEAWEGLWHACGRRGPLGDFLKGLIHLAAAGVKVRQGQPQGVRNHARRAEELFRQVAATASRGEERYLGLAWTDLLAVAQGLAEQPQPETGAGARPIDVVLRPD